jgi:uncharacterized repeat protein (TIGR02543 family)
MTTARIRTAKGVLLSGLLAAGAWAAGTQTQISRYASQPVTLGPGGYSLHFSMTWSSDDFPQPTTSAPGQIDLVDAGGNLLGRITGTIGGGKPIVSVSGAGSASAIQASESRLGAGGTPADGLVSGTWVVTGVAPGAYALRFWYFQEAQSGSQADTIYTQAADAGGSGPLGEAAPSPPTVTLSAPAATTVLASTAIAAGASASSGTDPLASVAIDASADNGSTWLAILVDSSPSNPNDTESLSYAFPQAASYLVRVTATDTAGLMTSTQQSVGVAKASQGAVILSPQSSSITQGQSLLFTASGGATGNYAWSGSASGAGTSQSVVFPSTGTFTVSVLDSGNATYGPSPAASATVSVQPAFYSLAVAATAGGAASGGGSYARGSQASAVATASPGYAFTGWTGDATGPGSPLIVSMNSNKSVLANFAALLSQVISFVPPAQVSTNAPPFAISASSSSGLAVSLALVSGPATLSANTVSLTGAPGTVVLNATQGGNAQYLAAQPVAISFTVGSPPSGVLFQDDSAATKRQDRFTRVTALRSGPEN